jgi:malate dehydrogenase
VDELALYDVVNTPGVATDLSHISTPAVRTSQRHSPTSDVTKTFVSRRKLTSHFQKITGFLPKDVGMAKAFSGADVVIIPAGIPRSFSLQASLASTNEGIS